ncbi:MAG: DUF2071 domain-containing protein [Verrucomicrobiales bacterium]|nr:DUF2071 domain-containing protein [Verrucomicrobiales bacterium]
MRSLNQHPFAVQAHFEKSLVLAFAFPKEELQVLVPSCLQLDLYQDQWAFVAVALVKTRYLRPKGLPECMGRDFILAGYRVFVRYRGEDGRLLRGLYILASETDSKMMQLMGNLFTCYHYSTVSIDWKSGADGSERVEASSGLELWASRQGEGGGDPSLPAGSPFASWKDARRFAGPMPFTFSHDEKRDRMLVVEGRRSTWRPLAMGVEKWQVPFLQQRGLLQPCLANAFLVEQVPYEWQKGRLENLAERL